MKLYTVWSGEYSDRCLHKIFQSKEKAQKYVEVCNQLYDGYGDFYMCEYELADEKITNDIDSREFIINKITKYNDPNVVQNITVYTTHGYHIARKIAIEQYQIWQQQQLVDGYFSSENIPLESIDDKFYLPGDDI